MLLRVILMLLLLFAIFSFLIVSALIRETIRHSKEISVIWDYYSARYKLPAKFIRKQYKLEKKDILIFYYYQLIVCDVWWLLNIIIPLIWFISGFNEYAIKISYMGYLVLVLINIIVIEVKTTLFRRKKKTQKYKPK